VNPTAQISSYVKLINPRDILWIVLLIVNNAILCNLNFVKRVLC
jgi:hypothetical protein